MATTKSTAKATRAQLAATRQPMPAAVDVNRWQPPQSDEEFVFNGIESCPSWVDRNWASFNNGPALAVPAGDIYGKPPYTTKIAHLGDTVKFMAAVGATAAHFEVIAGEIDPDSAAGTTKIPQVTNASLEDLLKGGHMSVGDLGTDAAAQVAMRSPELQGMLDGSQRAPAPADEVAA